MQPVAVEEDVLEASAAGDQRRRDAAGDGVVAEVEMPELAEAAELPRQRAVEAVLREVEPPQVGGLPSAGLTSPAMPAPARSSATTRPRRRPPRRRTTRRATGTVGSIRRPMTPGLATGRRRSRAS